MTIEQAKLLLPLIQAYAEGKTIQFKNQGTKWLDLPDPHFDDPNIDLYRIKPENKYRPWTFEEAPLLVIFKTKYCDSKLIFNSVSEFGYLSKSATYDFKQMLEDFLYSSDNGKTWLPCGTLI